MGGAATGGGGESAGGGRGGPGLGGSRADLSVEGAGLAAEVAFGVDKGEEEGRVIEAVWARGAWGVWARGRRVGAWTA